MNSSSALKFPFGSFLVQLMGMLNCFTVPSVFDGTVNIKQQSDFILLLTRNVCCSLVYKTKSGKKHNLLVSAVYF